jgi:hypothetical protein
VRPRREIENEIEEAPGMNDRLLIEVLLDIRDILNKIERDQPLGA